MHHAFYFQLELPDCPICGGRHVKLVEWPDMDQSYTVVEGEAGDWWEPGDGHVTFPVNLKHSRGNGWELTLPGYPGTTWTGQLLNFPPDHPPLDFGAHGAVFAQAKAELRTQLIPLFEREQGALRNSIGRLLVAQIFAAFEAYLADAILWAAKNSGEIRQRLVQRIESLRNGKYSLLEIWRRPNLFEEEIESYLRSIVYHNLPTVSKTSIVVYGLDVLPSEHGPNSGLGGGNWGDDLSFLKRMVSLRHDVIHRNGKDHSGGAPFIFQAQQLLDLLTLTEWVEGRILAVEARIVRHETVEMRSPHSGVSL